MAEGKPPVPQGGRLAGLYSPRLGRGRIDIETQSELSGRRAKMRGSVTMEDYSRILNSYSGGCTHVCRASKLEALETCVHPTVYECMKVGKLPHFSELGAEGSAETQAILPMQCKSLTSCPAAHEAVVNVLKEKLLESPGSTSYRLCPEVYRCWLLASSHVT